MKRVGIVIDWYLPRIGGAEIYAYHLAKYLTKNGYQVSFFTLDEKNTAEFIDEFPITRVPFDQGIMGKIRFYLDLKKFLDGVDIIHAIYCHKFASYASVYNWFHRKPFFITLQGRGILDLPGNNWLYGLVHTFYRVVSLKSASMVIAACREFVWRAARYIPESKIVYLPNGVDMEMFQNTNGSQSSLAEKYQNRKVILTVRRLVPKNGLQYLVEAAPAILAKHPDAHFVFVGYGELEGYLKERAQTLGIEQYIEFAGRVDNKLVPDYLKVAQVVVFPSTAEATSLACLEAMAMGKAIVASNVGGYPEMIDDGVSGYLVKLVDWQDSNYAAPLTIPAERILALAEKISDVLGNSDLKQRFGEAAAQKVRVVFDWNILIKKIIQLHHHAESGIQTVPAEALSSRGSYTALGIHLDTHDSGAAVVKDGLILSAVSEERLSRIKMDPGIPRLSVPETLRVAGVKASELHVVAISGLPSGWRKLFYFFWQQNIRIWFTHGLYLRSFLKSGAFSFGRLLKQTGLWRVKHYFTVERGIRELIGKLRDQGFKGEVIFTNHDLNHAAGAYYTSGRDKGLIIILEGSSFLNTASVWWAESGQLKKIDEIPLPHSLGFFYEVVTTLLGFDARKHGGKITGLAGFGDPKVCGEKVAVLLYNEDDTIKASPKLYELYDEYFGHGRKMPPYFKGISREHIAAAFQRRLEEVSLLYIQKILKKYPSDTLLLGGGVCANVKLNREIMHLPEVEHIFVHPGMGDVGQALGAALIAYCRHNSGYKPFQLHDVYFGPSYSNEEIEAVLKKYNLTYTCETDIAVAAGGLLAQNKVVGFFQGRMEYGPRALGNRSIMYPATDAKVNDWLNKQLKRTEFMPFAPVTLAERAHECYEADELQKGAGALEFMTLAVKVTPYMKEKMPAAVHVDNTARPQLITEDINPLYYKMLKEYERLTGLPSLINTSFNMHEEPIVCTPEEGVKAYLASHLDALAIGDFLVINPNGMSKSQFVN